MIARIAAGAIGAGDVATGLVMLLAPSAFVRFTPGVADTGPINPHFLTDVGLAFLAAGALVICGAWTNRWDLAAAGALWPVLHALLHVAGLASGANSAHPADLITVIAPTTVLVIAVAAMRSRTAVVQP